MEDEINQRLREDAAVLVGIAKQKTDYESLKSTLETYSNQPSYTTMIPFGPLAFMPGKLVKTGEVLALLGAGTFAEYSTKDAAALCDRRLEVLAKQEQSIRAQVELLQGKSNVAKMIKGTEEYNKEGIYEIREEYNSDEETRRPFTVPYEGKSRSHADTSGMMPSTSDRLTELSKKSPLHSVLKTEGSRKHNVTPDPIISSKHHKSAPQTTALESEMELLDIRDSKQRKQQEDEEELEFERRVETDEFYRTNDSSSDDDGALDEIFGSDSGSEGDEDDERDFEGSDDGTSEQSEEAMFQGHGKRSMDSDDGVWLDSGRHKVGKTEEGGEFEFESILDELDELERQEEQWLAHGGTEDTLPASLRAAGATENMAVEDSGAGVGSDLPKKQPALSRRNQPKQQEASTSKPGKRRSVKFGENELAYIPSQQHNVRMEKGLDEVAPMFIRPEEMEQPAAVMQETVVERSVPRPQMSVASVAKRLSDLQMESHQQPPPPQPSSQPYLPPQVRKQRERQQEQDEETLSEQAPTGILKKIPLGKGHASTMYGARETQSMHTSSTTSASKPQQQRQEHVQERPVVPVSMPSNVFADVVVEKTGERTEEEQPMAPQQPAGRVSKFKLARQQRS